MKRQLIKEQDLIARTIEGICIDEGDCYITFTDGTFVKFIAERGWDEARVELATEFSILFNRNRATKTLGIVSREEYDAEQKRQDDLFKAKQESEDRAQYLILKARFEPTDNSTSPIEGVV